MGHDDEGTLARLKAIRSALVEPSIGAHRGRLVKTIGDGMLIEFASAVDAARSAIEFQRGMAAQNDGIPPDKRIEFRVGIHVGDIMIDDNDIFGDGVNIAARLENNADPGGICISDDAYRQIRGKVDMTFEDMGVLTLKNTAVICGPIASTAAWTTSSISRTGLLRRLLPHLKFNWRWAKAQGCGENAQAVYWPMNIS